MFKIGDKIKCIHTISEREGGPKIGEIFIVTSIDSRSVGFRLNRLRSFYGEGIISGKIPNWGLANFIKVKEINNKYEWLDAVRENFKDGY